MEGRIPLALTNNTPPLWINWINNPIYGFIKETKYPFLD